MLSEQPSISSKFPRFESAVIMESLLNEGAHQSYRAEEIINVLGNLYDIGWEESFLENKNELGINYERSFENEEIPLIVLYIPNNFHDKDKINRFFIAAGWTLASTEPYKKRKNYTTYIFEKNKQTMEVKNKEFLYHLTPSNKVHKILKNGLCPKSGNKLSRHPERIYLFLQRVSDYTFSRFADDLWYSVNKEKKKRDVQYSLLKIDTKKCRDDFKIYCDPDLKNAVWTYDNIPPEAITIEGGNL